MKIQSLTIAQLQAIRYKDNRETLVDLAKVCPEILCEHRRKDSGVNSVLVRQSVAEKLRKVQKKLSAKDSKFQLLVVEGYRTPSYQESYYLKQLLLQHGKNPKLKFEKLLEQTHQFVALPSVAGHPTGGAIDLTIASEGKEIDMGGRIADFSNEDLLPTHSRLTSSAQAEHRLLLHDLMKEEGFAPFYGEWWHFSYGDREWAVFYGLPDAIYSPIY